MSRQYYSARTGKNPLATRLDLPMLRRLFRELYLKFSRKEYFQESFGYNCVDAGDVPGLLGGDVESELFRILRKSDLWPIPNKCLEYTEDDLFDIIEFLYDNVSKPVDGFYHNFSNCGWHYQTFNEGLGRQEFITDVNLLLRDYQDGYELSADGEILVMAEQGLENLLQANVPLHDPENVDKRINNAVLKYRRYRSSFEDRRDAIRDLADVLEFLRPKLKLVITRSDEGDLFNIANNFGVRHHNDSQKTDYDKAIWYSWIFYYYLATIHATIRLIQKYEKEGGLVAP
ncbi:MAG: hypothetical protein HZC40_10235 [Chloroflexi bacterium]|nr:hypothetical protein [Chloroflexota bacterium]